MPGPPPTPLHLKLLRGNPGKRPLHREPEPRREVECPEPPSFLGGLAVGEWRRIAPELHVLGLLTVVDVMPLAVYCEAYERWCEAVEGLARMAEGDELARGLTVQSADGTPRVNPLVRVVSQAAEDMLRAAREFGLTPAARARLAGVSPPPPGGGKFGGLLA